jgi:hypothetical protein
MFARSPLWEVPSFRQRSRFVKALRRGEPIPPELHSLSVRVAQDIIGAGVRSGCTSGWRSCRR